MQKKHNPFIPLSIYLICVYLISLSSVIYCQSQKIVQPTQITGSNSLSYDANTTTYYFYHNGNIRYSYKVNPLYSTTTNGGTLNTLWAYADDGSKFVPSNFGGISAFLNGGPKVPWDANIDYKCLGNRVLSGDTVETYWQMRHYGTITDYINYKYKLKIVGRTLVIRVEVDKDYSDKVLSFEFDRSEACNNPHPIAVPYITKFHILLTNGIFTSFFADWELSNASMITPYDGRNYSSASAWYSQSVIYDQKTDNKRNRMLETLYLTTSPNIEDVFPNIPNDQSTFKDTSANLLVWDYRQPFGRLITTPTGAPGMHLKRLHDAGIRNLWVQIHDWQQYHGNPMWGRKTGHDDGYPDVYPANTTYEVGSEYGGNVMLNKVIDTAVNYGYRVGLHENYVDCYKDASFYSDDMIALNKDGTLDSTIFTDRGGRAFLLKPSLAESYCSKVSANIHAGLPKISGCYLDVHSAGIPSPDYNASITGAGMYKTTLDIYRKLYGILRKNYKGPVQGEGGAQFLFQGYVDDIEARLCAPNNFQPGYNFPLFVNFDFAKLHSLAAVHGVGWFPLWKGFGNPVPNYDEVLSYIATELAYGHGAYLCDEINTGIDLIDHAKLQYKYVFSVQKELANATATEILYNDGGTMRTASDYIIKHPENYNNIKSSEFMGQVRIKYDNGVVVCVNRCTDKNWNDVNTRIGVPNGWFNFHTSSGLDTGVCSNNSFDLPSNNGWVVYDPLHTPFNASISGPSAIYHPEKNYPQQTYTWSAAVAGGKTPYTYKWYQNGILVGTGQTYSVTLGFTGYYDAWTWPLSVEITDNSSAKQTITASKSIIEHSASDWLGKNVNDNEVNNMPKEFVIQQNYPNPFNPETSIKFELPEVASVKLIIYNVLGQEITTLENNILKPGYYQKLWNGSDAFGRKVSSGIYFYRFCAKGVSGKEYNKFVKMIMLK